VPTAEIEPGRGLGVELAEGGARGLDCPGEVLAIAMEQAEGQQRTGRLDPVSGDLIEQRRPAEQLLRLGKTPLVLA
jgi:hypothetical protein